jgi:hypothetical protein
MANLVAKRCALLERPEDRKLIWFLQLLSHQGGIKQLAAELMAKYPERVATQTMQEFGTKQGKQYSASQVKVLRKEFDIEPDALPLYGEINEGYLADLIQYAPKDADPHEMARVDAKEHPKTYPLTEFQKYCVDAARAGLENHLLALCLDPSQSVTDGAPWYFPRLISTLHEFHQIWTDARQPQVITSIGETLCGALEYAVARRRLVIINGAARTGKSHATKTWCNLLRTV